MITQQIKNQDPQAIEIYNMFIQNKEFAQKQNVVNKRKLTAEEIMQKFKERLLQMLKNQKALQQSQNVLQLIDYLIDQLGRKVRRPSKLSSSGLEKMRKVVEEQLIKKKLKTFKILNLNEFNLFDLYRFKLSLLEVFDEKAFPNIGRKYFLYGSNIFKNEYMRQLAVKVPHFLKDLRVNLESDPWSLELQQDQQSLKIVTGQKRTEINNLFKSSIMKKDFFQVIKKFTSNKKDEEMQNAIRNFYYDCGGENAQRIISPNLIQFIERVLFLNNIQINRNTGKAYKNYFTLLKNNEDYQIKEIILCNCQMEDETLELIMKGIVSQNQVFYEKKKFKSQIDYLRSFVYSKNYLSAKGVEQLYKTFHGIFEVKLDNLKIMNPKMLLGEILHNIYYQARYIMRLMITNMDIGSSKIVKCFINVIMENKYLQQLDITATNMKPRHLLEISNEIKNHKSQFRELNFSFNKLDFSTPFSNQYEDSIEFLENIMEILEGSRILNHLNLSGMDIEKKQIIQLCRAGSRSPILMGLHLNDNGINQMEEDYLSECLNCFGLTLDDMPLQRKIFVNEQELLFQKSKQFKYVDLQQAVKKYTRLQGEHEDEQQMIDEGLQMIDHSKKIKDNIDLGKELKDIMQSKAINQTRISKSGESMMDYFVITRNLNHPELIFNQNVNFDKNRNQRFFVRDFESRWRVSLTNECFVCDKYQFVMIFYERGDTAQNQDLVQIKDKAILEHLTYDYKKNYLEYRSDTPLICGSLVKRKVNQRPFERKLKMLRASLFSLLSICQQKDFSTKQIYTSCIKNGILKYLQHDKFEIFKILQIDQCLKGWEFPLNDMILNNELTDLKTVNFPDLTSKNIGQQNWYIFAGFFEPGYHQVLIHDPQTEKAYFKDIVVQLNQREFVYPEYPVPLSRLAQVVEEDIWKEWKIDNYKTIKLMFQAEVQPQLEQYIRFMKNKEETELCLNIIYNNYDNINLYFKELLVGSRVYPLADFDNVYQLISQAQEDPEFKWYKIPKPQIYIQYLSTLKYRDGAKSTNIQRAELIEFILRIGKVQVIEMKRSKEKVSNHLHQIFRDYILPVTIKSNYQSINKMIRNSYRLNKLIEDNLPGLQKIYEFETNKSEKSLFDRKTAISYFKRFIGNGMMEIENQVLEECFVFSMMTVSDEKFNLKKYDYLYYVEFQDMLCRVAYFGFVEQEPIQYKVFWLFEYMWNEYYKKGIWKPDVMPLYPINTDVIW